MLATTRAHAAFRAVARAGESPVDFAPALGGIRALVASHPEQEDLVDCLAECIRAAVGHAARCSPAGPRDPSCAAGLDDLENLVRRHPQRGAALRHYVIALEEVREMAALHVDVAIHDALDDRIRSLASGEIGDAEARKAIIARLQAVLDWDSSHEKSRPQGIPALGRAMAARHPEDPEVRELHASTLIDEMERVGWDLVLVGPLLEELRGLLRRHAGDEEVHGALVHALGTLIDGVEGCGDTTRRRPLVPELAALVHNRGEDDSRHAREVVMNALRGWAGARR